MAPTQALATLLALSAIAAAQSSVLSLPFFGYDDQSIVGSVIAVESSITTIALACPDSQNDDEGCGLFPYQTLTVGPSTYNMYMSDEGFIGTQQCTTTDTVNLFCVESASGSEANFPGVSTVSYDATDVAVIGVTVTAGASKLAAGAAATTTGPASTSASATGSATSSESVILVTGSNGVSSSTLAKSTGTAKSSSTGSASAGAASSSTQTGGAAIATAVPMVLAAGAGLLGMLL